MKHIIKQTPHNTPTPHQRRKQNAPHQTDKAQPYKKNRGPEKVAKTTTQHKNYFWKCKATQEAVKSCLRFLSGVAGIFVGKTHGKTMLDYIFKY